jgi:hypothetical protein
MPLYPASLPPNEQKDGWVPEAVWTLWRREKCLAANENPTTVAKLSSP